MSFLRDWLLGIVAAALAVALAQALTPEGAVKKVGRLVGGLALALAVLRPLTRWTPQAPPDFGGDLTGSAGAAEAGERVGKALIAREAGAYIVDKGAQLGVSCAARVTVAEDGSGWAVPWAAEMTGAWTEETRRELSRIVAEDLNIPAERQSFQEEVP